MTIVVDRALPQISNSLFHYLREVQYELAGVSGAHYLPFYFRRLRVMLGYPDDLVKLVDPTLGIGPATRISQDTRYLGGVSDDLYIIPIYGFVLRQGNDAANKIYRDRLMNDVYQLLARDAQDAGIPLYEEDSDVVIGDVEVVDVTARAIPMNVEIDAERYKFLVESQVSYAGVPTGSAPRVQAPFERADRGRVTFTEGVTSMAVVFDTPQLDADYYLTLGLRRGIGDPPLTTFWDRDSTVDGFTIEIGADPGPGSSLIVEWILAR